MAVDVPVFMVDVQGVLTAPASGKTAVDKENVQATASAEMEAVPGDASNGVIKASINHANAEQLVQTLNDVGLKKAQAIVSYCKEYGPFKTLGDLRQAPGMESALMERNLAHLAL